MRYWQDIQSGEVFQTGTRKVTREEIFDFAAKFDPQPYHLDDEAAEASIFGGLCASGWQVSALMMRLLTDAFRQEGIALMGESAVSQMRWKIPVFAGDSLTASITVKGTAAESHWPGQGVIECDVLVSNQDSRPVISLTTSLLIAHRQENEDAG